MLDPLTIQAGLGVLASVVWLLWPLRHKLGRKVMTGLTDEGLDVVAVVAPATGKQ